MEIRDLWVSAVAGMLLGGMFFGGLWFTTLWLPRVRRPYRLLVMSLLLRTALVLGGFYLVMADRWERLLVCLLGFVVARTVILFRFRPASSRTML
ncbi:MAG: F1F0 ATPase [Pirellulaceae bacterium]|nr:MAG: F1F0 ATPase [Pirellulaceae bacterium]